MAKWNPSLEEHGIQQHEAPSTSFNPVFLEVCSTSVPSVFQDVACHGPLTLEILAYRSVCIRNFRFFNMLPLALWLSEKRMSAWTLFMFVVVVVFLFFVCCLCKEPFYSIEACVFCEALGHSDLVHHLSLQTGKLEQSHCQVHGWTRTEAQISQAPFRVPECTFGRLSCPL